MADNILQVLTALLVMAGAGITANLAYSLFRSIRRIPFGEAQVSFAMQSMGVVATINSLLLAFMAISVWETYKAADNSAMNEATAVALLGRNLAYYGGKSASAARDGVRAYADCVLKDEWGMMASGDSNPVCLAKLEDAFRLTARIEPRSGREEVLLGEIWARANEMSRCRRERLQAGRTTVPGTLWLVTAFGALISIALTFVMPPAVSTRIIIGLVAAAFGLVFHFIVVMQRPFSGPDAIRPVGFERVLRNMETWDRRSMENQNPGRQ
ncbi:MAG: DUF4239 domain-containing protein [Elusimicrobia bacterium]|nr:DUF4239 domain-containing protein [Elusimicrobiota bacterium]